MRVKKYQQWVTILEKIVPTFLLNLKSNRSKEKLNKTFVCGIIRMPNKGGGFVEHK